MEEESGGDAGETGGGVEAAAEAAPPPPPPPHSWVVELARSGRGNCYTSRKKIGKDILRIGRQGDTWHGTRWHLPAALFKSKQSLPANTRDITGYGSLQKKHQTMLQKLVDAANAAARAAPKKKTRTRRLLWKANKKGRYLDGSIYMYKHRQRPVYIGQSGRGKMHARHKEHRAVARRIRGGGRVLRFDQYFERIWATLPEADFKIQQLEYRKFYPSSDSKDDEDAAAVAMQAWLDKQEVCVCVWVGGCRVCV